MVWIVLMCEEEEIKNKKLGVDIFDCILSLVNCISALLMFQVWFLWWTEPLIMILMQPAVVSHSCQSCVSSSSSPSNSLSPSLFGSSGFLELMTAPSRTVVTFCPLLMALFNLTDAELCKSDEFNVIRYFRFLHAGCLDERKQWYQTHWSHPGSVTPQKKLPSLPV